MPIKQDNEALADALDRGVRDMLDQLIDGTYQDLDGPIREISQRLAIAVRRSGRGDLVEACQDQLSLILLEKQLAFDDNQGTGVLEMFVTVGVNALVNGALGGILSLKVV